MIMRKKLLSILALLCLTVTSAWATNYTSFSGGEVLKPGDTFSIAEGYWEINETVFQSSNSPFTVLRANVFPGDNPEVDPTTVNEDENGMFYVIKDNNGSYYFTDTEKMNLLPVTNNNTSPPSMYDGILVYKISDTEYMFFGHEAPAASSGYCGDPSVNNGEDVTWEVDGTTITISGTGAMANFDSPYMGYGTPAPWLAAYADDITSIVIEEGVTTVGEYAFEDCHLVESISIPASVTSIGKMAFYSCGYTDDWTTTDLTVTIASGSNLETIGNSAFEYCTMASFSIPSGVKTIDEGAFSYCFGLTSIEMPASVMSIGKNAFYFCKNLATLTLNSNPFIHATAFDVAGESVGVFPGSTTVTMNLTATVGTTGEYWMTFYNQNHNFQVPATGTQIFKAALGDDKLLLTELTTDKRVNANNAVILKSATASITLTRTTAGSSNDFTGNDLAGVSAVAGATSDGTFYALNDGTQDVGFYPVASGTKVALGNAYVTSESSSDFLPFVNVLASGYCGAPSVNDGKDVTYSLTDDGVMTISGTGAMADNDYETPWSAYQNDITSVVIENGVTSVGTRAFTSCSNVTSVSLPANLQAIGAMAFARCGITTITLPASLETIGMRAFQDTKITSVNIPAGVTSIDELAFGYCGSLAEITVAAGNTIYEAPNGCNALIVKATHTLIQGCNGTVFANLPDDLKSIAEAAFAGCTSLTTASFPNGLESIGGNAFEDCSGLTTVTIPASVTSIGEYAFGWCDNLTTVTIYATSLTTYGEEAFGDSFSGTIYVPAGSGETYKAGWAAYASKIEEMAAPATHNVTFADGLTDWTATPTSAAEGTTVTLNYTGKKKVKSITITKKEAPAPKALSAAAVGDVVGSDGLAYADIANLPEGVTAVAKVGYVNGSNGLALAMADEANKLTWSEAIETCAAHTPAINGATWKLANKAEWSNMIEAGVFGDTDLNLKKGNWDTYWSSEEKNADQVYGYCYDPGEWSVSYKDATFMYTRACLAW